MEKGVYVLDLTLKVMAKGVPTPVVDVQCFASFIFNEPIPLEEIPDFFYPNSIAIIFPYIRAFISNITLQANIPSLILLPTMHLGFLQEDLKNNTITE